MDPLQVDFLPDSVKKYAGYSLVMDVEGVGQGLVSLPIVAECVVPEVAIGLSTVEYGDVFLRYAYTETVPVSNDSADLRAKFTLLPQDDAQK
jgi:hydrocephalus-inducing protein